ARRMNAHEHFDAYIEERHHRRKADAPSGTARELAEIVLSEIERKKTYGFCEAAPAPEMLSVASTRAGDIVGVHRLAFVSEHEQIALTHEALDRGCFAEGAVFAAEWLALQKPGVYRFSDCFV
ncbi:MAG: 4-hydroxy-tetrahydrodipicolinate reductase, partial [Bacteroidia bacterium]|nr:4-hydroxy-tetrahydrodipicolinate reductase [Bacteroidia bacterium]